MPHPVVHFEIMSGPGEQGQALQQFYRDAFQWDVAVSPEFGDYGLVAPQDGKGIGGGIGPSDLGPYASVMIEVADPAEALKAVQQHGGRVLVDVTEMPGVVTFAMFRDPAGNTVGIVKAAEQS